MLFFDIGANRGDATEVALSKGYEVVALEPAPIYSELVKRYIYDKRVFCLRNAVSDQDNESVDFYVCEEDGLSTLNLDWLTKETMPYVGRAYTPVKVNTVTIDTLARIYGEPDLIKIDVEGAEWNVLRGMSKAMGILTFEWTFVTLDEHEAQLDYLYSIGYREVAPQYIVHHLDEPKDWFELLPNNKNQLLAWHQETSDDWHKGGWQVAGLRPNADVGMCWLR